MSEDDFLRLIEQAESGEEIPERSVATMIVRMWAMDRAERRKWHRSVKIAGLVVTLLAGGGGLGVVSAVPEVQPVIMPAQVETVALSGEQRLDAVEPRVDGLESAVRQLEGLVIDGLGWAADAMSRKRGAKMPELPPSMQDARTRIDDRRRAEDRSRGISGPR